MANYLKQLNPDIWNLLLEYLPLTDLENLKITYKLANKHVKKYLYNRIFNLEYLKTQERYVDKELSKLWVRISHLQGVQVSINRQKEFEGQRPFCQYRHYYKDIWLTESKTGHREYPLRATPHTIKNIANIIEVFARHGYYMRAPTKAETTHGIVFVFIRTSPDTQWEGCKICGDYFHTYHKCPTAHCENCDGYGHLAYKCPDNHCEICDTKGHLTTKCSYRICTYCKKRGHIKTECYKLQNKNQTKTHPTKTHYRSIYFRRK